MTTYKGYAWVYPANVTTDDILPGQYLDRKSEEVGQFAMAGIDPGFVSKIQEGDIIVGGSNFGSGSGRETAPVAIVLSGISAVIAPSFSRLFYRNSINFGLPAVKIESVDDFKEGDEVIIDMDAREVINKRANKNYPFQNLQGTSLEVLLAGGIIPFTKQRMKNSLAGEK